MSFTIDDAVIDEGFYDPDNWEQSQDGTFRLRGLVSSSVSMNVADDNGIPVIDVILDSPESNLPSSHHYSLDHPVGQFYNALAKSYRAN